MNRENLLLQDVIEHLSEYLEMANDEEACALIINALASMVVKARDEADWYRMAHKQCVIRSMAK